MSTANSSSTGPTSNWTFSPTPSAIAASNSALMPLTASASPAHESVMCRILAAIRQDTRPKPPSRLIPQCSDQESGLHRTPQKFTVTTGHPAVYRPPRAGAYMPFFYGRWDNAAQAHVDAGVSERSRPVRDGFGAAGAFNPAATRGEVSRLPVPLLVHAGGMG